MGTLGGGPSDSDLPNLRPVVFGRERPDQGHPTPFLLRPQTTTRNGVRTYNDADEQLSFIQWDSRGRFSAESPRPVSSPSLRQHFRARSGSKSAFLPRSARIPSGV